jgi:hypothetical protein
MKKGRFSTAQVKDNLLGINHSAPFPKDENTIFEHIAPEEKL